MNWPTFIIASLVVIIFVAIVMREIRNRKNGKGGCSCGGSCGGCGLNGTCHSQK